MSFLGWERFVCPTRYPPAYAHSRSNGGTPISYVGDEVRRTMHRPITRPQTPARGGLRIPAESQPAPSARSLPGIRITIVSPHHAPSIIAPRQGSGAALGFRAAPAT